MPFHPGTTFTVIVRAHRYRCPVCGHTVRQEILFRYPGTNITRRAAAWIKAFLMANSPVSEIEQLIGIHWDAIRKIHEEQID